MNITIGIKHGPNANVPSLTRGTKIGWCTLKNSLVSSISTRIATVLAHTPIPVSLLLQIE